MTALTGLGVTKTSGLGTLPKMMRLFLASQLEFDPAGGSPLSVKLGVFSDDRTPVVSGAASMTYNVRACIFAMNPSGSAANGPVIAANDAQVTGIATDPAPGANSRYDLIWVRQHIPAADAGGDADVQLVWGVTKGTVAASPTKPFGSVPTGALVLGSCLVTAGAGATNTLTFTREHNWIGGRAIDPATDSLVRVYRNAAFTLAAAGSDVIFDTVSFGNTSLFNTTTGIYTAPETGFYRVSGQLVTISGAAEAVVQMAVYVNGVMVSSVAVRGTTSTAISQNVNGSHVVYALAGQAIKVQGAHSGVGSINGVPASVNTYATFERIG